MSPDTTSPRKLIPCPSKLHSRQLTLGSLQKDMGLSNKSERFNDAILLLRPLVRKHFDRKKTWGEQDSWRLKAFCKDAVKADKIFARYSKCWPAVKYAHEHFRYVRKMYRLKVERDQRGEPSDVVEIDESTDDDKDGGSAPYSGSESDDDDDDDDDCASRRGSESDKDESSQGSDVGAMSTSKIVKGESISVPPPSKSASSQPIPRRSPRTASASQVASSPAAGSALLARMSGFRALLRDLDAVLAANFGKLQLAGIDSVDDLRTLMAFPRHEQERFLRQYFGVTKPLELAKLCVALDRAQAKMQAGDPE